MKILNLLLLFLLFSLLTSCKNSSVIYLGATPLTRISLDGYDDLQAANVLQHYLYASSGSTHCSLSGRQRHDCIGER